MRYNPKMKVYSPSTRHPWLDACHAEEFAALVMTVGMVLVAITLAAWAIG